jgi:hypothetical protein
MLQHVAHNVMIKKKKRIVQLVLIYHLHNHGHPMNEYITLKWLFVHLNVFHNLKNYSLKGFIARLQMQCVNKSFLKFKM